MNLCLKMEGLPPSLRPLKELRGVRSGFTLTGEEAHEGLNELVRALRLVNPKSYVVKDYIAQNPEQPPQSYITS